MAGSRCAWCMREREAENWESGQLLFACDWLCREGRSAHAIRSQKERKSWNKSQYLLGANKERFASLKPFLIIEPKLLRPIL
jgi:hypothetical protein